MFQYSPIYSVNREINLFLSYLNYPYLLLGFKLICWLIVTDLLIITLGTRDLIRLKMSHSEADTKASRCTQEKNLLYSSKIENSVFPVDTLKLKLGSPSNLDILGVYFNVWDF